MAVKVIVQVFKNADWTEGPSTFAMSLVLARVSLVFNDPVAIATGSLPRRHSSHTSPAPALASLVQYAG